MRRHLFLLLFCILTALGVVWAFDVTWDDTNPTKASKAKDIAAYIRLDTKKAIMERFAVDHVPAFIGDTSSETVGYHKAVHLYHQSTTPETTSVGAVLWSQEDDSVSHLYFRRADGDIIRVDSANDEPADGSVTETKLADGAVTTDKIADGTITESKVEDALRQNRMWFASARDNDTPETWYTPIDSMTITETFVASQLELTLSLPMVFNPDLPGGNTVSFVLTDDTDQETLVESVAMAQGVDFRYVMLHAAKTVTAGPRTFTARWNEYSGSSWTGSNDETDKKYRYFTIKEFRIP